MKLAPLKFIRSIPNLLFPIRTLHKYLVPGLLLIFTSLFVGCGRGLDLGDFDKTAWQEDVNGCNGQRVSNIKSLNKLKKDLLGLYQKKIIEVLGQPEEQELYKRSQTYYLYYIDPSMNCDNGVENPRKLEIRFTALGIANEINIR